MGGRAVLDIRTLYDYDNAFRHTAQVQTLPCFLFSVGGDSGKMVGYTVDSFPPT